MLDTYGLSVRVRGDWAEVVEAVRLDFAWFEDAGADPEQEAAVEVLIERAPADLDGFGSLPASFVTPRYTVFADRSRTIVDYHGAATGVVSGDGGSLTVRGEDEQALHEAVYYFLLGGIGEHLDGQGLVRVHGLGLAGDDGGVLLLLPSSGGKSTLALQALRHEEGRLLSEDSPLLDRDGRLRPFPLRLAVSSVPEALVAPGGRVLPHPVLGEKLAVEVEAFADRVQAEPVPLRHVVLGRRSLGAESRLDERSRAAAVMPLITNAVVGVGLYQGFGYVHQRGPEAVAAKLLLAARRARVSFGALRQARVWELTQGRDIEQCWRTLSALLR